MWHFGKGQALRLGRPSIFITSPLVIWKLASPIFVSPLSLPAPAILSHPLILPLFSFSFFFTSSSLFVLLFFSVMSCLVYSEKTGGAFSVNMEKIITVGIRKQDFTHTYTHIRTHAQGLRGAAGSGDRMSTPAVRIVVTERRANTNVINTSALTPGTLCASVCVCFCLCLMFLEMLLRASYFCQTDI